MPYPSEHACQYCRHALNSHNNQVGCEHCTCAATAAEGNGELVELLPNDQAVPGYRPLRPSPPSPTPAEERIREMRWNVRGNGTWPGKVEHGCQHPTLTDGPLDRVSIHPTEKAAREEVAGLTSRGIPARYVTRTIPAWTDPDEEAGREADALHDTAPVPTELFEQLATITAAEEGLDAADAGTSVTPTPETVQGAIDLIAAGAALGMTLPTPAGLTVWEVSCYALGDEVATLGPYGSKEAATAGLRNWILEQWDIESSAPWDEEAGSSLAARRAAWLANHTDEEICSLYAAQYGGENQKIYRAVVLPAPDRPSESA